MQVMDILIKDCDMSRSRQEKETIFIIDPSLLDFHVCPIEGLHAEGLLAPGGIGQAN